VCKNSFRRRLVCDVSRDRLDAQARADRLKIHGASGDHVDLGPLINEGLDQAEAQAPASPGHDYDLIPEAHSVRSVGCLRTKTDEISKRSHSAIWPLAQTGLLRLRLHGLEQNLASARRLNPPRTWRRTAWRYA
jgi:hypothetical protein